METVALLALVVASMLTGTAGAELWVSADGAPGGIIAGAQVIRVSVDDRAETAEPAGEPTVTVGSMELRMVQGADARWHAYFADARAAQVAEATVVTDGTGLDFGTVCGGDSEANELLAHVTGADQDYFADTDGVAFPLGGVCGKGYGDGVRAMSVLRNERAANLAYGIGQSIRVEGDARAAADGVWPFIQLYDLRSNVEVRHENDTVLLEYGTTRDVAALALDRSVYPPGADVHVEVSDVWLNIDPTDEDSWTWDVDGEGIGRAIYRAFDSRGEPTGNVADVSRSFGALGCDETCSLHIDLGNGALEAVSNRNGRNSLDSSGGAGGIITLVETGPNTGIFASYDSANASSLKASRDAPRGAAMTVSYGSVRSILIGHGDASLDLGTGGAWPSGTRAEVTLSDTDANQNSRQRDTLDVADAGAAIPTIVTGEPLTLIDAASIGALDAGGRAAGIGHETDSHGARALVTPTDPITGLTVNYGNARAPVHAVRTVTNLLNYDVRSTGATAVDIYVVAGAQKVAVASGQARGLVEIPHAAVEAILAGTGLGLEFDLGRPVSPEGTIAIVADIFSFGIADGQRVANQVVRLELEETGTDTGTFAGTLEYMLANQLSVADAATYADLATIGERASMIAVDGDEDITMTYDDRAADGSRRIVSGMASTASHTGSVSFDRDEYGTSDTVTVTLRDADLNTNPDTAESYRVGPVGGGLLVLTLNGIQWTDRQGCPAPGPSLSLLETGTATGVFVGQLRVPQEWCDGESPRPMSTARAKIGITYADYVDSRGTLDVAGDESPRVAGRTMPLAISGVEVLKRMQGAERIAVEITGHAGTAFELVVQVVSEDGTVGRIVTEEHTIDGDGRLRAVISWDHGDGREHVQVFAWRNGVALAAPSGVAISGGMASP